MGDPGMNLFCYIIVSHTQGFPVTPSKNVFLNSCFEPQMPYYPITHPGDDR